MAAKPSSKSTNKRNTKRPPPNVATANGETTAMTATATKTIETIETRTPSHDEIARRAYELFLARGREHGRAKEDWLTAERELHARYAVN